MNLQLVSEVRVVLCTIHSNFTDTKATNSNWRRKKKKKEICKEKKVLKKKTKQTKILREIK